ncbi:hypothetical protein ILUMI_25110 [Ignelater luminosus]|uniref:Uncharacterized protein n=1 Tax=Ignelater luminosus TaxID=2038154 RepID=A0A8K0C906_IGNLU|nr:hypothetical protein ILUMI_25110 [Ignelater luminosus]
MGLQQGLFKQTPLVVGHFCPTKSLKKTLKSTLKVILPDDNLADNSLLHTEIRIQDNRHRQQKTGHRNETVEDALDATAQVKNEKAPRWKNLDGVIIKERASTTVDYVHGLFHDCLISLGKLPIKQQQTEKKPKKMPSPASEDSSPMVSIHSQHNGQPWRHRQSSIRSRETRRLRLRHGRVPEKPTRKGPETIISMEEEQKLVDWMLKMLYLVCQRIGFLENQTVDE